MIRAEEANYPVALMCRVLGVSRSGYYAWLRRSPSRREVENRELAVHIRKVYRLSRGTYGSHRIRAELQARGFRVGRHRVARLMRLEGLQGRRKRRYRSTTDSSHGQKVAPNLLDRRFEVGQRDRVWAADITCYWTTEGWLYLAVILDLYSRRVVGWAMDGTMRTDLVLGALEMALIRRRPPSGLLHHSDQGSQYASEAYRKRLEEHEIVQSMSRRGNCWDNAVVESFFSTVEAELESRSTWTTRDAARTAIHEYIEVFYNQRRRHSHLGYLSPAEYERLANSRPADAA